MDTPSFLLKIVHLLYHILDKMATVDSSDSSGAEPIKYYEADGKYYVEMYGLINEMNENLSSLTVTPYARTGAEEGVPHEYKNFDAAAFTVEYDE